jgi:hypothetical protein
MLTMNVTGMGTAATYSPFALRASRSPMLSWYRVVKPAYIRLNLQSTDRGGGLTNKVSVSSLHVFGLLWWVRDLLV